MNNENQEIDKLTGDLLKKSLQQPFSSNFDDLLMEKILLAPSPAQLKANGNGTKKAWVYLMIAIVCFLFSAISIGQFTGGYFKELSTVLSATINYVFYGGLALFIPLVFYHFDSLVQLAFTKKAENFSLV